MKYASRVENMRVSAEAVKLLFGAHGEPEMINFSCGSPAHECLPAQEIAEYAADILSPGKRGTESLAYGLIPGTPDLRQVVIDYFLKRYHIDAGPDQIMITTGGLEPIGQTCHLFVEPGDVILVESPTFFHAMATFDMFEAKIIGVEMDAQGMVMEDLEAKIIKYEPKLIYVIPTFQNPSGRTLPIDRRKKIAELAEKYDVPVLEDDPYRELRFSGEDLPPIKAFDRSGHVIFASSFSKCFGAGYRLGYVTACDEIMGKLLGVKGAVNSHTSIVAQILCAEYFRRGYYDGHIRQLNGVLLERRDMMMAAIEKYFPEGTVHTNPDGGLFAWVELPGGIDTRELLQEARAREDIKVTFTAGRTFFAGNMVKNNCMRLSFGDVSQEKIEEGIKRLGRLIAEKTDQNI